MLTTSIVKRTFRDQTASTVDTSGMELDELKVLEWQARSRDHGITVTSASMCTRAAEVCSTIATSCQHGLMSPETVKCSIFHVECHYTNTLSILHDQVERKVLNKEVGVMSKGLSVKRMKNGMSCTISGSCTSVCLSTLSEFQGLTTKSSLVDLPLFRS